jgi:hypothetical protein
MLDSLRPSGSGPSSEMLASGLESAGVWRTPAGRSMHRRPREPPRRCPSARTLRRWCAGRSVGSPGTCWPTCPPPRRRPRWRTTRRTAAGTASTWRGPRALRGARRRRAGCRPSRGAQRVSARAGRLHAKVSGRTWGRVQQGMGRGSPSLHACEAEVRGSSRTAARARRTGVAVREAAAALGAPAAAAGARRRGRQARRRASAARRPRARSARPRRGRRARGSCHCARAGAAARPGWSPDAHGLCHAWLFGAHCGPACCGMRTAKR